MPNEFNVIFVLGGMGCMGLMCIMRVASARDLRKTEGGPRRSRGRATLQALRLFFRRQCQMARMREMWFLVKTPSLNPSLSLRPSPSLSLSLSRNPNQPQSSRMRSLVCCPLSMVIG